MAQTSTSSGVLADIKNETSVPDRGRARYPAYLTADGQRRKPYLHRRGTSKTLESLADVLAEAGYKETRVLTPAGERAATDDDDAADTTSASSSVGAVMEFLTSLVTTRSLGRAAGRRMPAGGVPTFNVEHADDSAPPSATSTSSLRPHLRAQDSLRGVLASPASTAIVQRRLAANGVLRHAVSSPSLKHQHRAGSQHRSRKRPRVPLDPSPPPVPSIPADTWLAALTKALAIHPRLNAVPLGDRTNSMRIAVSPSPLRIRRGRPAQSTVSRTNVTCRSTPASRSTSLARRAGTFTPEPPVLGLTLTENDPFSPEDPDYYHDDSLMDHPDDDDEHTPVTLAHILAPRALARRQRSIVSLRRNLQNMTPSMSERAGTWGPAQFDDDGFPIMSPTQAANNKKGSVRRRGPMPTWIPEDV